MGNEREGTRTDYLTVNNVSNTVNKVSRTALRVRLSLSVNRDYSRPTSGLASAILRHRPVSTTCERVCLEHPLPPEPLQLPSMNVVIVTMQPTSAIIHVLYDIQPAFKHKNYAF